LSNAPACSTNIEGSPGKGQIRPIALGLIWRGDELLVFEGYDPADGEIFYRPLGGGIRFGERSEETLRREFGEELGVELAEVRYVDTLENVFVHDGQPGHEIVLLYEAAVTDSSFYGREVFEVHEDNGLVLTAHWMALSEFGGEGPPLVPEGLLALLTREGEVR